MSMTTWSRPSAGRAPSTLAVVGAVVSLVAGCNGSTPRTSEGAEPAPPTAPSAQASAAGSSSPTPTAPAQGHGSPWVSPLPTPSLATPTTFVVRNGTNAAAQIDITDGTAWAVAVGSADAALGPVSLHGDTYCDCLCAGPGASCRQCEPPMHASQTVPAAGRWELPWTGELKRPSANAAGRCGRVFSAPPGEYEFAVCSEQGVCGLTTTTLPQTAPIVITLGVGYPDDWDCQRDRRRTSRAARAGLHRMHVSDIGRERLSSCDPEQVTCLPPGAALPTDSVAARPCALFAQATDDGFALTVLARLPDESAGSGTFVHEWDRAGLRLRRVRYSR